MIHTDYALARIRAYLNDRKATKSRLAFNADVPEGCIREVHSDGWNPTIGTVRKIEMAIPADYKPNEEKNPPPGNEEKRKGK